MIIYVCAIFWGAIGETVKTGTTVAQIARLVATQIRAGEQQGGWSTERIRHHGVRGINRAVLE